MRRRRHECRTDDHFVHRGRRGGAYVLGSGYLAQSQRILGTSQTEAEFIEAMRAAFPEREGMYIVDLMAKMKFSEGDAE